MTQPLVTSTRNAVGQPSSVRMGTITSVSPLILTVQGAPYSSDAVGVLGWYVPAVGDVVAVLGQSVATGSDPQSWLILGLVRQADANAGLSVSAVQMATATAVLNLTSIQTPVTGASLTVTTTRDNATILVHWHVDFEAIGATLTTGVCHLVVDGITASPQALWEMPTAAAAGRVTAGQTDTQILATAGAHTVRLDGQRAGGADNMIRINNLHTTLTVIVYE